MTVSVVLRGEGWGLAAPTLLADPRRVVRVDEPSELPRLLEFLDGVSGSGDPAAVVAGYVTYEAGLALEGCPELARSPRTTPLALFALYDLGRARATAAGESGPVWTGDAGAGQVSSLDRRAWRDAVEAVREGIARGDVYQVNLTRRIRRAGRVDPFALAASLYAENPVPYAIACVSEDHAVVSNSPELFLSHDARRLHAASAPIKGTAPRGAPDAVAGLLASEKDAAEHLMIVDLVRNDLGRVAVPRGVTVPRFRTVRSFRHLHHLESTVAARLEPTARLSSVLRALLPAGSITGAPKRAALRFIHELEPVARGPYTGAAGIVRGDGRAVFNVAIRTAVVHADGVDYHAGGGIVWDSEAEAEWRETETKSREFLAVTRAPAGEPA